LIQRAMSLATAPLPENIDELRVFAASLQTKYGTIIDQNNQLVEAHKTLETEVQIYRDEIYAKTLHIEKLKAQLAVLRRAQFGRSSEKLDQQIEQLEFTLGDLEEGHGAYKAKQTSKVPLLSLTAHSKEQEKTPRRTLPDHLPRERVEHEAACSCPACGGTRLTKIGTDEREVLEYVPSHFKVIVHARPKMSCRDCETITQEPVPSLPIVRGMPGAGLLAHILISKFDDHLPYYRQSEIYAREGVALDRSTLANWVGYMANLLEPLAHALETHVKAGETIHVDDTTVPVLDPGKGKTKTGRLWAVVRDERPWGSTSPPAVFYRYSPDRKGEHPQDFLKDGKGYMHADAYAGYNPLYEVDPKTEKAQFIEVACWAHGRRKIYDVHEQTASPAALAVLERISELFAIEAEIKGQKPEVRLKVRQEQSVPKLSELKILLDATLNKISGRSTLAEAIRYTSTRWIAMTRYTTDGRLEMTNNAAERAERPVAIGRKNWMFAGSDDGGRRAAIAYTLIESAKMNGLNPETYLRDIIGRIADHPIKRIDELLPWNIKS
jgi:transposase